MFTTFVTLALFGLVAAVFVDLARQDGTKMLAALQGRSPAAVATSKRVIVRLSPRYRAAAPAWPALRVAA
jgi:hypothetical protein